MDVTAAFDLISHAIDTGHAAHGYLLVGDLDGSCIELTNRILHKLFPDDYDLVESRGLADVFYLEPNGARRIVRVEDMRRNLVAPMELASFSGGWKVGVIISADRMEPPSANTFLKSLEEPTPKTLYLLLTDAPDAILPTILSRTQRIDLPRSEGILTGEIEEAMSIAFAKKDAAGLARIISELKDDAEKTDGALVRKQFYRTLISYVRKIMISGRIPRHQAFRNIEAVEEAFRQSERSMNDEAVLSFMLDRIVFPS